METHSSELREISWILVLKVVALFIIWLLWFSAPQVIQSGTDFLSHLTTTR
jgi:predicted PurR-regulated permease PerM